MDRIQKALDRAKAKQSEQIVLTSPDTKKEEINRLTDDPLKLPIQNISYQQTRVAETPKEHLENNRIIAGMYGDHSLRFFVCFELKFCRKCEQTIGKHLRSPLQQQGKENL